MNSLFGNTNPLVSPMGQLIERAIDPYNPETNLELFFEVADWINAKEENSKDAFKSIRKLLSTYAGRNWVVVTKILVLLDTCTNNCNRRFQTQLASKEFLNELKHMIGPKNQPPLSVQEKVLALIQHWVTLFKGDPEFKVIESFYAEMRSKGIEFPKYDPEAFTAAATDVALPQNATGGSPKRSPPPSHPQPPQLAANLQNARYQRLNEAHQLPSGGVIRLNEDQMGKLNSELDIVESNVQVLNDVLTHLQQQSNSTKLNDPSNEDVLLAKELSKTCREMQKRITQLIGNVANENTINELLRINDDLNNVFLRYERFERAHNLVDTASSQENNSFNSSTIPFNAAAATASATAATAAANRSISQTKPEEKPLIDFGDSDVVTPKPTTSADLLADTFQQFEISPNNGAKPTTQRASGSGAAGGSDDFNSEMNQFLQDENEIKEMEQWFQLQGGASNFGTDDFARSIQPATDASNDNRLNSQVKSDRAPIN